MLSKLAYVTVLALTLSACGSSTAPSSTTTTTTDTATATVTDLIVSGATVLTGVGQRSHLSAVANFSDGTTSTVTAQAVWTSSDTTVAAVSGGVLTTIGAGMTHITVGYGATTGSLDLTVDPVTTTFRGGVVSGDGQRGTFTLIMRGASAATDTMTTAQISGTFQLGATAPYALTGLYEAYTGAVYLSTSDAPLRFSAAMAGGSLSGSYSEFSGPGGTFASTSVTVAPQP